MFARDTPRPEETRFYPVPEPFFFYKKMKKLIETKNITQEDREKVSTSKKYKDAAHCIAQASKKSMTDSVKYYIWPTHDRYVVSKVNDSCPNHGYIEVYMDIARFYA